MWILVVDDTPSNTIFFTEALKALGHRSVVSCDPLAALALLDQMAFDGVIVDYHMPTINAPEFIAALRAKFTVPDKSMPVIVATADPSPNLEARVKRFGAATVLHKPVSIYALAMALQGL